jgi:RNA polymerase sigma factor (sigma-70 family)
MNCQKNCDCGPCLLHQIQAVDPSTKQSGWAAWYLRDRDALYAYVAKRATAIGGLPLVEDIVQDSFEIGFKNVTNGRYRCNGRSLRAYLKGIAKNLIQEANRLSQRECSELPPDDFLVARWTSVEVMFLLNEYLDRIMGAYDALAPLQQKILDAKYSRGKTAQQVGEALDLSPENMRIIAFRAINFMRKTLQKEHNLEISARGIRLALEALGQELSSTQRVTNDLAQTYVNRASQHKPNLIADVDEAECGNHVARSDVAFEFQERVLAR